MARSVIAYDKDLPEIPGRLPWLKPDAHLVKDGKAETGWRVASGRRESRLLLVPKIRTAVDDWRDQGYPGASAVTRRLFEYWFEEDHDVPGFSAPFRYYFCQREAMETLAWLVGIAAKRDAVGLIRSCAEVYKKDLFSGNIVFQTTMDGRRQIVRYVPELDKEGVQDLPPLTAAKTVFNYVATYNDFERRFGEFLDRASDVLRFASLGTTEQGESGTQFRVDYIKPSGAIGFYHPDWVAVQKADDQEVNWIIETKGRVWEGTRAKDEAIGSWCRRVSEQTSERWRYVRINQKDVDLSKSVSIAALVDGIQKRVPNIFNAGG